MLLAKPMRLCAHGRYLLYLTRDGGKWCFCDVPVDPAYRHLDDRMEGIRAKWEALGRAKEWADG
ncbi:hypothetical protein [Pseudonocardia aurantiaca]|uniref:Uncharacterized protein n=1 Tax=Pseudonocardia aurantiaca TaxID=75290 RepID=A0ABW4FKQ8_9PSEU